MRPAFRFAPLTIVPAIFLLGCGYAGEPKPPALRRPYQVTELTAVERGPKIVVTFVLPWETTEGLPIEGSPDVEVRVGAVPNPWSEDAWRQSSERVPVPEVKVAVVAPAEARAKSAEPARTATGVSGGTGRRAATGASRRNGARAATGGSGAAGASGKKSIFGFAKNATRAPDAPTRVVPAKASLLRTVSVDAARYSDKTVVVGVLVHGPKGRDDGWRTIRLDVLPVLPVPRDLRAVDAPNAVHLQWSGDAPAFRIYRRLRAENGAPAEWELVGDNISGNSYDDVSFHYGKTWQYYVQSVRKAGDNWMESDPSETFTFTPVDHFPPAVPGGLVVISGTRTMELVWDRVADTDLAGYRVYRNGAKIADALTTPAYSDKDVTVGSKYSYQVSAVDQAGNESGKCAAMEVTME